MAKNLTLVNRMLDITRLAEEKFDAYTREVSSETLKSRLTGDSARETMLEATLKQAKKDMEAMRQTLKKAVLSNKLVDDLEAGLKSKADDAEKLLRDMKTLGATLDRIAEGARVLTGALKLVRGLI
jgi:predicted RNase H-like nuclease (RuvC/YqgF family)